MTRSANLLGALAAVVLGCCAASNINTLHTRTTPEPADAHAISWVETFAVSDDGSRSHRVSQETIFHTEWAVDSLGDPRITYNTARETLRVVRAETTMRDGKSVTIQSNSVNATTPAALASAPAYADVRETVVTHVGLERGCTNHFEWEITSGPSDAPLNVVAPLHLAHTVTMRTVGISVPEGQEIRWQCLGCEASPVETRDAGRHTLAFTWEGLLGFHVGEDHGRPPLPGQPRLVASTATSWSEVAEPVLQSFLSAARPNDQVRARALSLAEDLATTEQRITALWRFVVEDIRTVDWPLADLGYAPSFAAEVLDRSYGHSLDKAVLLSALLGSLDLPSRPLLISRDALFAPEVPALDQFSEVWLIVDDGRAERWLSTTELLPGEGLAYLSGRTSLDLESGLPLEVVAPIDTSVKNQSRLVAKVEVDKRGQVTAEMRITLTGSYSPYFASHEDGNAAAAAGLLPPGWDAACEGCWLRTHHWAPDRVTVSTRAQRLARGEGDVLEVDLPWAPYSQLFAADIHRPSKATSTSLRSHGMESVHLEIRAADGLELDSELPQPFLSNSVGSLVSSHSLADGVLTVDTTLAIDNRVLDSDGYLSLRDLVSDLHRASGRSLLYTRSD